MTDTVNGHPLIQPSTNLHWMTNFLKEEPWRKDAACLEVDPDMFFEISEHQRGRNRDYAEAKKICASCDVAGQCLAWAMAQDGQWGVAGGLTAKERKQLKKRNS